MIWSIAIARTMSGESAQQVYARCLLIENLKADIEVAVQRYPIARETRGKCFEQLHRGERGEWLSAIRENESFRSVMRFEIRGGRQSVSEHNRRWNS